MAKSMLDKIKGLEDWQGRVWEEEAALSDKLIRLELFLDKPEFTALDEEEKELLRSQLIVMRNYEEILNKRLDRYLNRARN